MPENVRKLVADAFERLLKSKGLAEPSGKERTTLESSLGRRPFKAFARMSAFPAASATRRRYRPKQH
jgi:hypothetical protein